MDIQKRTRRLDWEDIRYFRRLAEVGSLSAAARSLGVNHATVSRHVASLEATLGTALFDRRPDGYVLTAEGRLLVDEAEAMAAAADAILDRIEDVGPPGGPVRLTATAMLAEHVLVPGLAPLRQTHPGIEILIDGRLLSIARREADIAIRLGHPRDSALLCRRLCDLAYDFYANADWAARLASGAAPAFVGFDVATSAVVAEALWLAERYPAARMALRVNGHTAQAAAARAGFGLALLPRFLGDADAALTRIDLGARPADRPVWLVTRPDLARQPRFRAVIDTIAPLFRAL